MTTVGIRSIYLDDRGVAWIEGTGIKVKEVIIDKIFLGLTPEEMLAQHSHWTLPQIYAALSYYYDHQAAVDEQIEQDRQEVEHLRAQEKNQLTRTELLQRLNRA